MGKGKVEKFGVDWTRSLDLMKLLFFIVLLIANIPVQADAVREELCQQRAKIFSDISWLKHQNIKEERAKIKIREMYMNMPDDILVQMISKLYHTTQLYDMHPYVVYKTAFEVCIKKRND